MHSHFGQGLDQGRSERSPPPIAATFLSINCSHNVYILYAAADDAVLK